MNGYRLMVVDADTEYAKSTAEFLSKIALFKIAGVASDGASALKLIKSAKPDVILLNPLLPGMDGLTLMQEIRRIKQSPIIICISEAYTSIGIELARRNGASYYVYKPIEPESLASVMIECCKAAHERKKLDSYREEISYNGELNGRIHNLLHELGFSFKFNGSEYLAKSVEIAMETPMALHNISTGIYNKMAAQLHISPACIERSMRTAITFADSEGRLTEKIGVVPTNKTCIRYLLQALQMQN